jgi:DNA-binding PadR family transcriptional regulator
MLRSQLGVDSGQMSRMLRSLETEQLITVKPSTADARVRVAQLTPKGLTERQRLDERSDAAATAILQPLDDAQRAELVSAMRTVERLITTSQIELRQADPASADAQRCLRAYVAELNRRATDRDFNPSKGSTASSDEVRPPRGAFVLAYLSGDEPHRHVRRLSGLRAQRSAGLWSERSERLPFRRAGCRRSTRRGGGG